MTAAGTFTPLKIFRVRHNSGCAIYNASCLLLHKKVFQEVTKREHCFGITESVLFSFIISKNHLYACLILAGHCDGTTPPPQGHPRVDPACATRMPGLAPVSVPAHLLSQGSLGFT